MNELVNELEMFENKTIKRVDLITMIKKYYPHYKDSSIRWVIYRLKKSGHISKINNEMYNLGAIKVYKPKFSSDIVYSLKNTLQFWFNDIKFAIYESTNLNEWVNHQISRMVIFIEVEKFFMNDVFRIVQDLHPNTLFNPSIDVFYLYKGDLIIIKQLITQSPVNHQYKTIKLEKLIVDFYTKDLINEFITDEEKEEVISIMFKTYLVNSKTILAYAKRRNNEEIIKKMLLKVQNSEVIEDDI